MKKYAYITSVLIGFIALAPGDQRVTTPAQAFPVGNTATVQSPIHLYRTLDRITLDKKNLECLAKNIYHEAGVESLEGKLAVAQVTFNRVNRGRWGGTVCQVVYAKSQFSWTLDKNKVKEKPAGRLWEASVAAAQQYLDGYRVNNLLDSTHYHTDWIETPRWARQHRPVQRIGSHLFYASLH